eukprot:TRINITY_DN1440_c0_g1_i6.p2 TRINITY_DN1440_c0_g1~~TRINITY_DN1440_c0_g1_i6.p2  ORF type:complete len:267 (+),score=89.26 TRINITY_DN1440_c0_g1_i6:1738-2538(+)
MDGKRKPHKRRKNERWREIAREKHRSLSQQSVGETRLTTYFPRISPSTESVAGMQEEGKAEGRRRHTLHEKGIEWRMKTFGNTQLGTREEVQVLERWLEEQLKGIEKVSDIDFPKHLEALQGVYSTVVHEIIRQISTECAERGFLLARVWVRFVELFKQNKEIMDDEFERLRALADEKETDLQRLKAAYEDDMNVVKESMISSDHEIADLRKKLHEANGRVERWKKRLGMRRKSALRSITSYEDKGKDGSEHIDDDEERSTEGKDE